MSARPFRYHYFCCLALLLLGVAHNDAAAAELKLKALLVWGTNDPKPDDDKLKELDPKLHKTLASVFKWKNYYEVKTVPVTLTGRSRRTAKISDKCELRVRHLGKYTVEVRFFGEGTHVTTKTQPLPPGEILAFAGNDENDTVWFVVLAHDEPEEPEPEKKKKPLEAQKPEK